MNAVSYTFVFTHTKKSRIIKSISERLLLLPNRRLEGGVLVVVQFSANAHLKSVADVEVWNLNDNDFSLILFLVKIVLEIVSVVLVVK